MKKLWEIYFDRARESVLPLEITRYMLLGLRLLKDEILEDERKEE